MPGMHGEWVFGCSRPPTRRRAKSWFSGLINKLNGSGTQRVRPPSGMYPTHPQQRCRDYDRVAAVTTEGTRTVHTTTELYMVQLGS